MSQLGTPSRPLTVAVIGSGPSGFYAAEALFKTPGLTVRVDMFDRLPTPYGLVRLGVAPDHQKIKQVTMVYERVALNPNFRFFGNVMLGRDIKVEDLRAHYDQIVYAVGNESDRKLGIPGEDLKGNHSATAFVAWYNGHPDYRDAQFDLTQERAAVIGIGNVAIDVARVLARDPEVLAKTDMAGHAVEALRKSKVKEVYLIGRRGPAQAAYSPAEIEEIGEMESSDLVVEPKEVELDAESQKAMTDPEVRKNVEYVQKMSKEAPKGRSRMVRLRFAQSPVEVIGKDGQTVALKLERNNLVPDGRGGVKAVGSGEFETIPVGLVFRSVGYRGIPIPGVPFDDKAGKIPNQDGRVLEAVGKPVVPSEYVVGWAKRGPSGLIGTNRACSVATAKLMVEDLQAGSVRQANDPAPEAMEKLLRSRDVSYITFQDWKKIDAAEQAAGKAKGKSREKITRVSEMLAQLKQPTVA